MATTSTKQASEMPTFSYAQAAKGLSAPPSAQQNKAAASSSDEKKTISPEAEAPDNNTTSTDTRRPSVNGTHEAVSKQIEPTEDAEKKPASLSDAPNELTSTATMLPKEDDPSSMANGTSDSTWDKQSQVSSTMDRSSQTTEASREKQSESESGWDKNSAPAKELKAAPIPVVNVWQQRREAQEAKAKAMSALSPTPAASFSSQSTSPKPGPGRGANDARTASRREPSGAATDNVDGTSNKDKRKQGAGYKSKGEGTLAPTDDAVSWPTPQSAAQDEGQKKSQQAEKPADKERPSRAHGKEKWMPVPYVPSAVFNTPLPQAARRGGRPARGGRESGSHASHDREKPANTSSAIPGSKKSQTQDRAPHAERDTMENGKGGAQDSAPKPMENGRPEQRRNTHTTQSENAHKDTKYGNRKERNQNYAEENRHSHPNPPENSFHSRQEPRSFSKTHDFPGSRFHGDGHGNNRYSVNNHDRHLESGPRSADFFKDRNTWGPGRDRDYQRNDVHRERGESRSERGGGRGGYRGRGGHSNYNGTQNPPYHSAPLAQQPFPPKSFSLNNDRHRSQQHPGSNNRTNIRSPSLSSTPMYGPAPYPIQTDMNAFYGYPHIPQGPMTAMHYQPHMEQFSLISMISMQLEYYFSVDNLCKDLFLRKHMDSQGFVLLSFIANFKRIKSLTEDMDLLRFVCRQLKNVEYRPGEDGSDRLRKREKWEQWVLNMDMRDPSAQNDGPAPLATFTPMEGNHDGMMSPLQADGSVPHTNGMSNGTPVAAVPQQFAPSDTTNMDGHRRSAKLSSTAPEFMPLMPPPAQAENTNVRKSVDDQAPFQDEQFENLMLVVRKPGISSPPVPAQSPFLVPSPSSRSFSFGSVDGYKAAGGTVTPENQFGFEPGEIESISEKLSVEQLQNPSQTGFSSIGLSEPTNRPISASWINAKDTPIEPPRSDIVYEPYDTYRKRTLEKRHSIPAHHGLLDMDVLYQFWSHYLVENFHKKMYNEFKSLAFDDFYVRNSDTGLANLTKFYEHALSNNESVLTDGVVRDLVDLAQTELKEKETEVENPAASPVAVPVPVLRNLRSAWRNGAFNLKSRRKIDRVISDSLRAELEK